MLWNSWLFFLHSLCHFATALCEWVIKENLQFQSQTSRTSGGSGGKSEAEIKEEEELQLAIALSQSEAEEKEKQKLRSTSSLFKNSLSSPSNSAPPASQVRIYSANLIFNQITFILKISGQNHCSRRVRSRASAVSRSRILGRERKGKGRRTV